MVIISTDHAEVDRGRQTDHPDRRIGTCGQEASTRLRPRRESATCGTVYMCALIPFWLVAACEVDVHEEAGPRVPVPNVVGRVLRAGAVAGDLDVELRTVPNADVVDSTETDEIFVVPKGRIVQGFHESFVFGHFLILSSF